jgi:replicative DNA helicase
VNNIEAKVISAVLKDKQIHVLMQANADELFETHKDIWIFIKDYVSANSTLPPESIVVENFRDFEPIIDIGATKHHLEELRANHIDSSLRKMLKSSAIELNNNKPTEALNILINESANLKKSTSSVRDIDVVDLEDALAHFQHIRELNETGSHGIKTGLAGFDNYMPAGITPGQFGILLAFPSIGKSWLALYLAVQAWKSGRKPLFMSLEMTETEVRNRAYAIMGGGRFSHRKLSAGQVDTDEFRSWGNIYFQNMPPFHIVSNDGVGDVSPAVVRGKISQYKPDIVFVDYIQLMQANNKTDNEVVKIKNISRELKILAVSEQVPIVAIASATPDDATDMTSVPSLGQVAWSKQLSYDADFVLALGRETNSDILSCIFRKNRNGMNGEFYLQVDFDKGKFIYKDMEDQ